MADAPTKPSPARVCRLVGWPQQRPQVILHAATTAYVRDLSVWVEITSKSDSRFARVKP